MRAPRIGMLALAAMMTVLTLGFGGGAAADHSREPASALVIPGLTDVSATTRTPALFTVTGKGFTSGGRVYLAVYDQMGAKLFETRWVTASLDTTARLHQPGDGAYQGDPVTTPGGDLRQAFAGLCGSTAMMRALDEASAVWSNWLPVRFPCANGDSPSWTGRPS